MDDLEGFKTLVEGVTADVVETARELAVNNFLAIRYFKLSMHIVNWS